MRFIAVSLVALLLGVLAQPVSAQATTPITAAQVLGCPPPLYPAKCAAPAFVPITNITYTIASVSKTAPVWAHTYGGYTVPTTLLVACPIGALVSGTSCTSAGADVSALVAKSAVAGFTLPVTPPPPPPATTANYTVTWAAAPATVGATVFSSLPSNVQQCVTFAAGSHTATACLPANP